MSKILLVDDMANFLDLEISFLNRIDCETLIAKNGMEAIKIAKAEMPDIILLDLEMPVMNGIECCRILKSDERLKQIPLVMVTSSDRMEECYKAGCDDFVKKPINEEKFIAEIRKFIEIKEREDFRVPLSVEISYATEGSEGESYFAYSRDLSQSGIFIITRDLFEVGQKLELNFRLDDQMLTAKGVVVRTTQEASGGRQVTGMGIRFADLDNQTRQIIADYIRNNN